MFIHPVFFPLYFPSNFLRTKHSLRNTISLTQTNGPINPYEKFEGKRKTITSCASLYTIVETKSKSRELKNLLETQVKAKP